MEENKYRPEFVVPPAHARLDESSSSSQMSPFVPEQTTLRELNPIALVVGIAMGFPFTAATVYFVLKSGLTMTAQIPIAIFSIILFRVLSKTGLRNASILEHTIVQSAGAVGEGIGFGAALTLPAILLLGGPLELSYILPITLAGGFLGILLVVPLRRALIIGEHERLKYPEGTACAEIAKTLVDRGRRIIMAGFATSFLYILLMQGLKLWKDYPTKLFGHPFFGGYLELENSPPLVGVGYIIGPRLALTLCAGGLFSSMVVSPLIYFIGSGVNRPIPPGSVTVGEMHYYDVLRTYIIYVGIGALAVGSLSALIRSMPAVWHGLKVGLRSASGRHDVYSARRDKDIPARYVFGGVILVALTGATASGASPAAWLVVFIFITVLGFLLVVISCVLTGQIGTSMTPITGITFVGLIAVCLLLRTLGWDTISYNTIALTLVVIFACAVSNANTASQVLKTGALLGSTPRSQQFAMLIGTTCAAFVICFVLIAVNDSATVYVPVSQIGQTVRAPVAELKEKERLVGPQRELDGKEYYVWQKKEAGYESPSGRYLVDEQGELIYFVDPGINGQHRTRPDGSAVDKFYAPRATMIAGLISGLSGGDSMSPENYLPLVIFGAAVAAVFELCGVSSLVFAVGLYLPVSSSLPIACGGLISRRAMRRRAGGAEGAQAIGAEATQPGVLMAAGYIAGGAIASIAIVMMTYGVMARLGQRLDEWAMERNPFYGGPFSDILSLLPFAAVVLLLYATAKSGKQSPSNRGA